jgi:hypothetical protein
MTDHQVTSNDILVALIEIMKKKGLLDEDEAREILDA